MNKSQSLSPESGRMLRRRSTDTAGVTQVVDLNKSDPATISPTIAHVPPLPTKEIAAQKSRFSQD